MSELSVENVSKEYPTRAEPLGLPVVVSDTLPDGDVFGVLAQYPGSSGLVRDWSATIEAVQAVDAGLGRIASALRIDDPSARVLLIVTADHGNADEMLEPDGSPDTAHSTNPVPLVVTVDGLSLRSGGILADVVPTALDLLGLAPAPGMTGRSLVEGPA